MLRISLFGEPSFEYKGAYYAFIAPPKTIEVLTALLLARGNGIERLSLAMRIWPDESEETARGNLRRHLHYMKRALPSDASWYLANRNMVRWNREAPYWLDIEAFEQGCTSVEGRLSAASLYRGDVFDRCDAEWIAYTREQMRNLQVSNLHSLIADARECGNYAFATELTLRLKAIDPWREDTLRTLMVLRAAQGDRAGAFREFQMFSERLRADLNAEPMEETVELYKALAAHKYPGVSHFQRRIAV